MPKQDTFKWLVRLDDGERTVTQAGTARGKTPGDAKDAVVRAIAKDARMRNPRVTYSSLESRRKH